MIVGMRQKAALRIDKNGWVAMNKEVQKPSSRESAQGLVEFALVLPLLLVLIMGVIEVGRLLFIYSSVTTASREAARYGSAAGDIGGYIPHYQDCAGIRAAARRMGNLAGIQDNDIVIQYDDGPNPPINVYASCPVGGLGPSPSEVALGDRISIQVMANYQPVVPLVNMPGFPITSSSSRTILKDITIEGTPAPYTGSTPTVSFSTSGQFVDEDVDEVRIYMQLSAASTSDVSVPFSVNLGSSTATPGDDYTISGSPVLIPAGDTTGYIVVTVIDDDLVEDNETVVVTMGNPSNAIRVSPDVHTLTINIDDLPTVSFTAESQDCPEATGCVGIVTQLSIVWVLDVSIPFSVSGTATEGVDFTITTSPVVIPAGSTNAFIVTSVITDVIDEDDETVVVTIGAPTNAILVAPSVHTVTIKDDDDPPTVFFTLLEQSVPETLGSITVEAQLSVASSKTIIVPFSVDLVASTATPGDDYTIPTTSPLVISPGSTTADITITIVDDGIQEADETVVLTLGAPTNATLGTPSVHTATITHTPTVWFTIESQSGAEDVVSLTIQVELLPANASDMVSVPYTLSGTAIQGVGDDYTITTSPLEIPAGDTSASIIITVNDDLLDEDDETVVVTLGTPTNADLGSPSVHTATITDNDLPPTVSFTSASQSGPEDVGSMAIGVQLSAVSGKEVTVPFSLGGTATQGAGADYTISPTNTVIIPAGSTTANISITVIDDSDDEPDETVVVSMGMPVNATTGSPNVHTATILDNDCSDFYMDPLDPSSQKISTTLYNNTGMETIITSILISWTSEGGSDVNLSTITFGPVIWSGTETPPSALIESGWVFAPTFGPGPKDLVFTYYSGNLDSGSVTVTFDNGCSISDPGG